MTVRRLAVAPKLCVTAFRRFYSEQRCRVWLRRRSGRGGNLAVAEARIGPLASNYTVCCNVTTEDQMRCDNGRTKY
jgi:hypothetical protein